MAYIDFLSSLHKSSVRDYLARVNDPDYPKPLADRAGKKWGFDYWDGDRRSVTEATATCQDAGHL